MTISLVTAPAAEPVTLAEAKSHTRVDISGDDTLITSLITVARNTCEGISNHRFVIQTWDIFLDAFPGEDTLELPKSLTPLVSVTHIKYYDENDSATTFSSDDYVVDIYSEPARIKLKDGSSWPSDTLRVMNGVEVRVVVGFGDESAVPQEYKQAILLLIGHWYENREQVTAKRPAGRAINPANAARNTGTEFHPGAIRYYREIEIWPGE